MGWDGRMGGIERERQRERQREEIERERERDMSRPLTFSFLYLRRCDLRGRGVGYSREGVS